MQNHNSTYVYIISLKYFPYAREQLSPTYYSNLKDLDSRAEFCVTLVSLYTSTQKIWTMRVMVVHALGVLGGFLFCFCFFYGVFFWGGVLFFVCIPRLTFGISRKTQGLEHIQDRILKHTQLLASLKFHMCWVFASGVVLDKGLDSVKSKRNVYILIKRNMKFYILQ